MIQLPDGLGDRIQISLKAIGDPSPIQSTQPVGGGCINHAMKLETEKHVYFLKWNAASPKGFFTSEAHGLQKLAETHTVRVPEVIAATDAEGSIPAFLIQEWIESPAGSGIDSEMLGRRLALLHRNGGTNVYGFAEDNFLGLTAQRNTESQDWVDFYRQMRLEPQIELARKSGRLPPDRSRRLEALIDHLDRWIDRSACKPALIHGDLWGGNVLAAMNGEPVLVDPAVSYSDREAELAYTELFGGFPLRFYMAYNEVWPLHPGYRERRGIYQLYHLLNHLNLFGENYGFWVDEVLSRYR